MFFSLSLSLPGLGLGVGRTPHPARVSLSLSLQGYGQEGVTPLARAPLAPPTIAEDFGEIALDTKASLAPGATSRTHPRMCFSFFLSAGLRGRSARPSGFKPALPPTVLLSGRHWGLTD